MPHYGARKAQPLTPDEEKLAGELYAGDALTTHEIARRFGRTSIQWLHDLAKRKRWPRRSKRWRKGGDVPKPPPKPVSIDGRRVHRTRAHKPKTARQFILEQRAANAERESELYGANVDDVTMLRRRGFIVTRTRAGYMVGNTECTAEALRAKADRERRLERAAVPA